MMINMFIRIMRKFCSKQGDSNATVKGSIRIKNLNRLAKAKKTRVFTNLDNEEDANFGKLIRELAKE